MVVRTKILRCRYPSEFLLFHPRWSWSREPDLQTRSGSNQNVPAPALQHCSCQKDLFKPGLWIRLNFCEIESSSFSECGSGSSSLILWLMKSFLLFFTCKNIKDSSKVRNNGPYANLHKLINLQFFPFSLHFSDFNYICLSCLPDDALCQLLRLLLAGSCHKGHAELFYWPSYIHCYPFILTWKTSLNTGITQYPVVFVGRIYESPCQCCGAGPILCATGSCGRHRSGFG